MATPKQKMAIKKVLNGTPISRAMAEVGYSESTAKHTVKLTQSKAWMELVESKLSDEELLKVHKEGLKAGKRIFKNNNETGEIEEVGYEPDFAVRHKYLETGYKLKNRFPSTGPQVAVQINVGEDRAQFDA